LNPNPPRSFKGSGHAKAILLGEHFVLSWEDSSGARHSGTPALVIPIPGLATEVELLPSVDPSIDARAPHFTLTAETRELVRKSLLRAARSFGWDLDARPLGLRASSSIPISRGFGSSAAFSVALCRAFAQATGESATTLAQRAREVEDLFHGRSSGLDIAGAISPEPALFADGEASRGFAQRAVDLVVVDSGPRSECSTLVQRILELRRSRPGDWKDLARQVCGLVEECRQAIDRRDGAAEVASVLTRSNAILDELGLVTGPARRILETGRSLGALSGKISGAGEGGAVLLAALPRAGSQLARSLEGAGIPVLAVVAASEG
jgi:mevalonate kinase